MSRRKPKGINLLDALMDDEVERDVEEALQELEPLSEMLPEIPATSEISLPAPVVVPEVTEATKSGAIPVVRCAHCRFFAESANTAPKFGHCHAVPPAVGTTGYRFPHLPAVEWCGYFQVKG